MDDISKPSFRLTNLTDAISINLRTATDGDPGDATKGDGGDQAEVVEADDVQTPGARQGARRGEEDGAGAEAPGQGQAADSVDTVIRRPRFPLTLRLAWLETEIGAAARLLPQLIDDLKELRLAAQGTDAKVVLVASVAVTALLPFGADPRKLEAFLEALTDDGDPEQADMLAAELVQDVLLGMFRPEGEGH